VTQQTDPKLTPQSEDALVYAARVHALQKRKGTDIPYIAHLLAVTALVLESGGDADEAIAALLHDAAEDQGGKARLEDIRRRFGDRVAEIVAGCTDTFEEPKPPSSERKKAFVQRIPDASQAVRRVALADKLHNARCILIDFHALGDRVWERFNLDKRGELCYYRSLVSAFQATDRNGLLQQLDMVVSDLERAVKDNSPRPD
jgi:(p)ppGpp synthase/HD superfamily hydrolase